MPFSRCESNPSQKPATNSALASPANAPEGKLPRGARDRSSSRPAGRAPTGRHRKFSNTIELECAADVLAALIHAGHVGLVPNRMMSINLEAAGIDDPVATIGRLMKLIRDAVKRTGGFAYIWVRERGPVVGDHAHILFHLPAMPQYWFARRKPSWFKRCNIQQGRGISHTARIHGAPTHMDVQVTCPELYSINLRNVTHYLLKHCSADVQLDLGIVSKGPCSVVGKRVSISENLHRGARSRCAECVRTVE